MAILQDSICYVKNENRAEISFIWASTEEFKEQEEQTIRLFSTVNVLLAKHDNDKLKFNVYFTLLFLILILKIYFILKQMLLKHPKEEIKKPLVNKQIIDDTNLDDKFYNQQFDSDPYLLD